MKKEQDYIIPFKGLSLGDHHFTFEIGEKFFESFEYFESETGKLSIEVDLDKESALLDFQFFIKGVVEVQCDRCLGMSSHPVEGNFRLIVKFGESYFEESEEVIVLPLNENSIDMGQYFFEFINLLLPIKRVHLDENQCDPEMIEKLHANSAQDTDPRWDALKNIKLK